MEMIMLHNGSIKKTALFSIYKRSCKKLHEILEGLIDQYPLLLLTLAVSNLDDEFQNKLLRPSEVKDVSKLFISALAETSQLSDEGLIKEAILGAKLEFNLMTEIYPINLLEMKLEVTNQMYLNTKEEFTFWLLEKVKMVEDVNTIVRPCEFDKFIQVTSSCNDSYHGNQEMWHYTTKWLGNVMKNRSMKIFAEILPNTTFTNIKSTLCLSNALTLVKTLSIFSFEDQIKDFCGMIFDFSILCNSKL